jgi:Nucleotide-diphospho-sugar transferase
LDVLIVTTQSHKVLSDTVFRPSLPANADADVLERQLDLAGAGAYNSSSWQLGVTAKLGWALDHMATLPADAPFILSDVDIQFFDGFRTAELLSLLEAHGVDVLFQKEHLKDESVEVNTGFYVARNRAWFRDLLQQAGELCAGLEVKNDQVAINELLEPRDLGTRWGFLPPAYYARSHGFPPRRGIVLHHANFSGNVDEKLRQLRHVRRYVTGGTVDRAKALGAECVDFVRSGKLRTVVRTKVKGS